MVIRNQFNHSRWFRKSARKIHPLTLFLVQSNTYNLIYQGDAVPLTNSRTAVSFVFPAPVAVFAGDLIGMFVSKGVNSVYDSDAADAFLFFYQDQPTTGSNITYDRSAANFRVNVDALFVAN